MDSKRFDDLTRLAGRGASRRSLLKALLGVGGSSAAATRSGESTDARTLRTRPTLPPPPPPDCQPGHQFCGGQDPEDCCPSGRCFDGMCCPDVATERCGGGCCISGQCTTQGECCDTGHPCGSLCCPEASSCGRSGNSDICCGGPAGGAPCGLDCCEDPYQCCDQECCGDDAVCLARTFDESSGFEDEVCCPADRVCDQQCCDGTCYLPIGEPMDFTGFPFSPALTERTCCQTGNAVCQGDANATCCDPVTEECCLRDGVAQCIPLGGCCLDEECGGNCQACDPRSWSCVYRCADDEECCLRDGETHCIPAGGCCLDEECGDSCLVCDLESGACVNPCAEDEAGSYCCQVVMSPGYICVEHDMCCPGEDCGTCGACSNGLCIEPGDEGTLCQPCKKCARQTSGLYECVGDASQFGDVCAECRICDESGGCTIFARDTSSCESVTNGVCCSGTCLPEGTCTTPDPRVCDPPCKVWGGCRFGECCTRASRCCSSLEDCISSCCSERGGRVYEGNCRYTGWACDASYLYGPCSMDSDCHDDRDTYCNEEFICVPNTTPPPPPTTTTIEPPPTTTTEGPSTTTSEAPTTTTGSPPTSTTTTEPPCGPEGCMACQLCVYDEVEDLYSCVDQCGECGFCDPPPACDDDQCDPEIAVCRDLPDVCTNVCAPCTPISDPDGPRECRPVDEGSNCGTGICCRVAAEAPIICEPVDGDPFCLHCGICDPCHRCDPADPNADLNGCVLNQDICGTCGVCVVLEEGAGYRCDRDFTIDPLNVCPRCYTCPSEGHGSTVPVGCVEDITNCIGACWRCQQDGDSLSCEPDDSKCDECEFCGLGIDEPRACKSLSAGETCNDIIGVCCDTGQGGLACQPGASSCAEVTTTTEAVTETFSSAASIECVPASCAALGCGSQQDGCGGEIDCGECCTPRDVCLEGECGMVDAGCGQSLECGDCPCVPTTVCDDQCGLIPDDCGGALDCGDCPKSSRIRSRT